MKTMMTLLFLIFTLQLIFVNASDDKESPKQILKRLQKESLDKLMKATFVYETNAYDNYVHVQTLGVEKKTVKNNDCQRGCKDCSVLLRAPCSHKWCYNCLTETYMGYKQRKKEGLVSSPPKSRKSTLQNPEEEKYEVEDSHALAKLVKDSQALAKLLKQMPIPQSDSLVAPQRRRGIRGSILMPVDSTRVVKKEFKNHKKICPECNLRLPDPIIQFSQYVLECNEKYPTQIDDFLYKFLINRLRIDKILVPQILQHRILFQATTRKDYDVLRLLLKQGIFMDNLQKLMHSQEIIRAVNEIHQGDINAQDERGRTALYHAVLIGNDELIPILMSNGANPMIFDFESHSTPLHKAIGYVNDLKILQSLITTETMYMENKNGVSPISMVARLTPNYPNFSKLMGIFILTPGWDVNWRDSQGCTALYRATLNGNEEMVHILFNLDADVDISNIHNVAPLQMGLLKIQNLKLLQKLITPSNINLKATSGATPIFKVAYMDAEPHDIEGIIDFLIKNGANIDIQDVQGRTPLYHAALQENAAMVVALLKHKANVNIPDYKNISPLTIAVKTIPNVEIIKKLITNKTIQMESKNGDNPLKRAKRSINTEKLNVEQHLIQLIVELLEVNQPDEFGRTRLWHACLAGNEKEVKLLLESGAIPHIYDYQNVSPLHNALGNIYNLEILNALITPETVNLQTLDESKCSPYLIATTIMAEKNAPNTTETIQLLIDHGAVWDSPHKNSTWKKTRTTK